MLIDTTDTIVCAFITFVQVNLLILADFFQLFCSLILAFTALTVVLIIHVNTIRVLYIFLHNLIPRTITVVYFIVCDQSVFMLRVLLRDSRVLQQDIKSVLDTYSYKSELSLDVHWSAASSDCCTLESEGHMPIS